MHKILVLLVLPLAAFASSAKKTVLQDSWGKGIKLRLELPKDHNDPGEYDSISIKKHKKVLYEKSGFVGEPFQAKGKRAHAFPKGTRKLKNLLAIVPLSKDKTGLVYQEWVGGSQADTLVVLAKEKDGSITEKFRGPVWRGTFKDYDGDSRTDLLVDGGHGEARGDGVFDYVPYLTYKQLESGNFVADERLSMRWSEENHYDWQGLKYSDTLRVSKSGQALKSK